MLHGCVYESRVYAWAEPRYSMLERCNALVGVPQAGSDLVCERVHHFKDLAFKGKARVTQTFKSSL
jgi:hypothetical protein